MGVSDYHAHLLEAGSATSKGEESDPRLIRYNTGYYPPEVGVEGVVLDLEDFRLTATMEEPRLSVFLKEMAINFDCALASKSSENGRRMADFRHSENMAKLDQKITREGLDNIDNELNYKEKKHNPSK